MKNVIKPLLLRSLLPRFQLRQPETENVIHVFKHANLGVVKQGQWTCREDWYVRTFKAVEAVLPFLVFLW